LIEVFEANTRLSKMIVQLTDGSSDHSCILKSYLSEFYPQVSVQALYSQQKKLFVYLVNTHHLSAQSHSDDNGFIRVDETMIITGIRLRRDRNDKFFYPSTGGGDYRNSNGFSAGSDGGSTSSSDDDEEDDDIVNGGYILNRKEIRRLYELRHYSAIAALASMLSDDDDSLKDLMGREGYESFRRALEFELDRDVNAMAIVDAMGMYAGFGGWSRSGLSGLEQAMTRANMGKPVFLRIQHNFLWRDFI
jgi:hypothetical protein